MTDDLSIVEELNNFRTIHTILCFFTVYILVMLPDVYINSVQSFYLQKCKGHFHVAIMVISVASVQGFPMVAVLLQSLTTNSWKQNGISMSGLYAAIIRTR